MLASCGKPGSEIPASRPTLTTDFEKIYNRHCIGCHGSDGRFGPAPPHNDALFLAIVPREVVLDVVTNGRPGTLMPALAGEQGEDLRPDQVESVVAGMFAHWSKPRSDFPPTLPSYTVEPGKGDVETGRRLFANICANCHGDQGYGNDSGALHNDAFLQLASRQLIRRTAITGRLDLGMPDYVILGAMGGDGPLTSAQITDIVAYIETWKPPRAETATQPAGTEEYEP
jgi:mono/diheme cytochrome c family protein